MLNKKTEPTKKIGIGNILTVVCFLTVMSQLPQIVSLGLSSLIAQVVWILFFGMVVYIKRDILIIKHFLISITFGVVYLIFVLLVSLISGTSYYTTGLFSVIVLSMFILFLSTQIGHDISSKDLINCGKAYILASLILAIDLYIFAYRGIDISNQQYQYASKNSAGVILMTAAIIAVMTDWRKLKKIEAIINIVCIAIFVVMIFIMKTRAMIVCVPVVIALLIWKAPMGKIFKTLLILLCVGSLIALQNEEVYDLVVNQIVFAGRKDNLDEMSSGRVNQWQHFGKYMEGNWIVGDGHTELESLILTAFVQCGALMGTLIILYALWPFLFSFVKVVRGDRSREIFLLLLISTVYFIDAIFEQLAPFGPGARCFYLWLILGILLSRSTKTEKERSLNYAR